MAKAAQSPELSAAFERHEGETEEQVERLEQVFELLGEPARGQLLATSLAEEENADQLLNQVARPLMAVAKMPAPVG